MKTIAATLGLGSVTLFCSSLVLFGSLNPEFDFFEDYVSKLGAVGQQNAFGWNLVGFFIVGLLITAFGFAYGRVVRDGWIQTLQMLFGLGFSMTAIPVDLANSSAPISKFHTVAICVGLGAWLVSLARLAHIKGPGAFVRRTANISAALIIFPILGYGIELWSMPMTHRLVFGVVFGWMIVTSVSLMGFRETDA